ncbi:MAG: Gfo/Idh/MocA family oxidoreductase [Chloroflexi bacterium]|nr:Gfo/Idh/MocA family oxidoreductase [Chloroflexota bacterium]
MVRIPIAIVGAGGMGGRHLRALGALYESGMANVELVAVCDLREDNAIHLADLAEQMLGSRPEVFTSMETMKKQRPDIEAVDITTDSGSHHKVAEMAFELGYNVLCEKPLSLTVRGCNRVIDAWKKSGKVLSVGEQERRDPMCRLNKALIDAGVIGKPYAFLLGSASGGSDIIIWPWRHYKNIGGIFVDAGVHAVDQIMYYMGDIEEVFAVSKVWEPKRYKGERIGVANFYDHWAKEVPDVIDADAEDMVISTLKFKSGAVGQWTSFYAAHGEPMRYGMIYGSKGSMDPATQRRGDPLTVTIDGVGKVTGDEVLELVPDFHLDELPARLFGSDRIGSYAGRVPFEDADRFLVALEYYELGQCIADGTKPEVDAYVGRKDLAVCNAALESSLLGRPVTVEEIENEQTAEYEKSINAHWKI